MSKKKDLQTVNDPGLNATLAILQGPWKILVVWNLRSGPKRFSDLRTDISGITQKMLTQAVKELATDNILTRKSYPEVPPRVEYNLTEFGKTLIAIIEPMHIWGNVQLGLAKPKELEKVVKRVKNIESEAIDEVNQKPKAKKLTKSASEILPEEKPKNAPTQLDLFG